MAGRLRQGRHSGHAGEFDGAGAGRPASRGRNLLHRAPDIPAPDQTFASPPIEKTKTEYAAIAAFGRRWRQVLLREAGIGGAEIEVLKADKILVCRADYSPGR